MMKKNPYNGFNNRMHKLPSPEDMDTDKLMSFTFNPLITPYDKDILDMPTYVNELMDTFKRLKYCRIKLFHEISSTGKFHFHGYIKIEDPMRFTIFDFPKLKPEGTLEIDHINDSAVWAKYALKQVNIMKPFCDSQKVPHTIDNIDGKLYTVKVDPLLQMRKCKREAIELEEFEERLHNKISYIVPNLGVPN